MEHLDRAKGYKLDTNVILGAWVLCFGTLYVLCVTKMWRRRTAPTEKLSDTAYGIGSAMAPMWGFTVPLMLIYLHFFEDDPLGMPGMVYIFLGALVLAILTFGPALFIPRPGRTTSPITGR
jgi:hypothetical protein